MSSTQNPVLNRLRETATTLRKPQHEVAANWARTPAMTRPYSAARNVGITRAEYQAGQRIIARLANA